MLNTTDTFRHSYYVNKLTLDLVPSQIGFILLAREYANRRWQLVRILGHNPERARRVYAVAKELAEQGQSLEQVRVAINLSLSAPATSEEEDFSMSSDIPKTP